MKKKNAKKDEVLKVVYFEVKVKESSVSTYIVKGNPNEINSKEDLLGDKFEIIDTLDDGMGDIVDDDIQSYRELTEKEIEDYSLED